MPVIQESISPDHLEAFFAAPLPNHVKNGFKDIRILAELNQERIMEIIGLSPPFLRIQKMIIASTDDQNILCSKSLGMGVVTEADTKGHYNELISLALCGQLMASTAAIHLAFLFPKTAPQAIEVNGIKPPVKGSEGAGKLWKPAAGGTIFFTEASVVRKKMHLAYATSKISFGSIRYGVIEELKFALVPAGVLSSANEISAV